MRWGGEVGNEPYEAQPGTEGIGELQGGSPVSNWWNNREGNLRVGNLIYDNDSY